MTQKIAFVNTYDPYPQQSEVFLFDVVNKSWSNTGRPCPLASELSACVTVPAPAGGGRAGGTLGGRGGRRGRFAGRDRGVDEHGGDQVAESEGSGQCDARIQGESVMDTDLFRQTTLSDSSQLQWFCARFSDL